jgi:hypothetical protein
MILQVCAARVRTDAARLHRATSSLLGGAESAGEDAIDGHTASIFAAESVGALNGAPPAVVEALLTSLAFVVSYCGQCARTHKQESAQ